MSSSSTGIPRIHWLSGVFGTVILLAGLAVLFVPGLAELLPIAEILLGPVALVGLTLGFWRLRIRYNADLEHLELPDPEFPFALPTPGDEFDEMLYRYTRRGEATLEYPERIGQRLRSVAAGAIAHRQDCTYEEALGQLDDGSWTDNQYAAAYFSEDVPDPQLSLGDKVRNLLGRGVDPYERQIEETVDAIVDVAALVDTSPSEQGTEEDEETGFLARFRGGGDDGQEQAAKARDRKSVMEYYDEDEGQLVSDGVRYLDTVWTSRWLGIEAFALVAGGLGAATARPALLLVAGVGIAYAAYAHSEGPPDLATLSVERDLSESSPSPGEEVTVTVTIRHEGNSFLPDLRLMDLVPPNMRVIDGSPRVYTALRPGATTRFQYTVIAERGNHDWPLLAAGSGFTGSIEREAVIQPEEGSVMECLPRLETVTEVPVRSQTTVFSGQVDTDLGGSGLEFHSVREYQPNDPMRRVNWKRVARTGELATIDFREERAANIVLLFDAREGAYVSDAPGNRHAMDRSVDAATEIYAALADKGDLVGVAAFDTVPCWLGPGAGTGHHETARRLFANHPALQSLPPEMQDVEGGYVDPMTHVRRQLPPSAQVMLFSPMISEYPAEVARRLDSLGHQVTVISPDPTADRTSGQRLATVERAIRVNRLRERGLNVVDWRTDESIRLTLEQANQRMIA